MAELVQTLAEALVDYPETVRVSERPGPDGVTVVEVAVDPEDRGRLIGRHGVTVTALRTLLAAAATRNGMRCRLEIAE
jgi:predicted RNA-binding protein YlqC (UPF0109 family)